MHDGALRANTDVKLRLALYSRECINQIAGRRASTTTRARGILYFFRSKESLATGTGNLRYLADHGLKIEIVDRDRLVELEPGLSQAEDSPAAIYSPMDQTGDSRLFVERLAACREKFGVTFLYGVRSVTWS